jgi:glycosyltransferase involved in cell wall biosynthesis
MKTLTIAHVLSSFGVGGQERVALDLASWQRRQGQRVLAVSVADGPEGPLADAFREHGVEAVSIPKGSGVDVQLPFRLAKLFTQHDVDVVHTHNPHALVYGAPAAGLARAASIHSKHGMNPDTARRLWLRRGVSTLVDAYVAVTPALARAALDSRESSAERLHVVPNGVDLSRFKPDTAAREAVRAELGIPPSAWVVGTVGRLAPEKNQALLLRAMMPLLDERRQLVIVGDGPERSALSALAAESWRSEYCHFVGARGDVERYLAAFDVFALSSVTEGLPLVLLEAMATGIPVVSTAVGGIGDLIERGETGLLVPSGDEPELRRQLLFLANFPTAALRIGAAGRKAALAKYSLEQMAERYQALYEEASQSRPRSRPVGEPPPRRARVLQRVEAPGG